MGPFGAEMGSRLVLAVALQSLRLDAHAPARLVLDAEQIVRRDIQCECEPRDITRLALGSLTSFSQSETALVFTPIFSASCACDSALSVRSSLILAPKLI